jgi:hypothetical protein
LIWLIPTACIAALSIFITASATKVGLGCIFEAERFVNGPILISHYGVATEPQWVMLELEI